MAGSPLSYPSGIIFDLGADQRLADLRRHVSTAIETVPGPEATSYGHLNAHLTMSYARADADPDQMQRWLRRVRPSHRHANRRGPPGRRVRRHGGQDDHMGARLCRIAE
jgi:hypothetical protein